MQPGTQCKKIDTVIFTMDNLNVAQNLCLLYLHNCPVIQGGDQTRLLYDWALSVDWLLNFKPWLVYKFLPKLHQ